VNIFSNRPQSVLELHANLPSDFGRVVRDVQGRVRAIVRGKAGHCRAATSDEVNSGVYVLIVPGLWPILQTLLANAVGEYYLTDL